jgi:hypothetical protein
MILYKSNRIRMRENTNKYMIYIILLVLFVEASYVCMYIIIRRCFTDKELFGFK